jgi:hypothetical protein
MFNSADSIPNRATPSTSTPPPPAPAAASAAITTPAENSNNSDPRGPITSTDHSNKQAFIHNMNDLRDNSENIQMMMMMQHQMGHGSTSKVPKSEDGVTRDFLGVELPRPAGMMNMQDVMQEQQQQQQQQHDHDQQLDFGDMQETVAMNYNMHASDHPQQQLYLQYHQLQARPHRLSSVYNADDDSSNRAAAAAATSTDHHHHLWYRASSDNFSSTLNNAANLADPSGNLLQHQHSSTRLAFPGYHNLAAASSADATAHGPDIDDHDWQKQKKNA